MIGIYMSDGIEIPRADQTGIALSGRELQVRAAPQPAIQAAVPIRRSIMHCTMNVFERSKDDEVDHT
jgi:hypothetical protein